MLFQCTIFKIIAAVEHQIAGVDCAEITIKKSIQMNGCSSPVSGWLISLHARSRTSRRTPSSRANSSYMYQNYVLVVNTRSSSALPNRRLPSCRGPRGKFNCVADHIQHHKFSTSTRAWFSYHRLDPSEPRSPSGLS